MFEIYELIVPSMSTLRSSQSDLTKEIVPITNWILFQTYPVVILRSIHPGDQLLLCLRVDLHHEAPLLLAVVIPLPPRDRLRGTVVAGGPSLGPV